MKRLLPIHSDAERILLCMRMKRWLRLWNPNLRFTPVPAIGTLPS